MAPAPAVPDRDSSARFVAQFCRDESLWVVNGEMVDEVEFYERLNAFAARHRGT